MCSHGGSISASPPPRPLRLVSDESESSDKFVSVQLLTLSCSEPPRRQASVSDLTYMINAQHKQPLRTGAIASFPNLEALKRGFDKVAGTLPLFDPVEYQQRYGANNQPPNVLNMALRVFNEADDMSDDAWYEKIVELVNSHRDVLTRRGVRRISILICRPG